jgi:hypothetical protein
MPLWRDPLDDLIGDLERTLPPREASRAFHDLPNLADLQYAVHAVLRGKEAWARAEREPRVQAVMECLTRLGRRRNDRKADSQSRTDGDP